MLARAADLVKLAGDLFAVRVWHGLCVPLRRLFKYLSSEIVAVLVFLLPGFLAASIYFAFTSHPRPGEFGRIVQALIFTGPP